MKPAPLTKTLLIAAALSAVAVAPAAAQGPGGGGGGGPRGGGPQDSRLLDEDLSLTGSLDQTSAGRSKTRTVTLDDGSTKTITSVHGAKAAGSVTSDIKTAAGADPGALTGALSYRTRSSSTRGSFDGVLTVTSSGGKLRLRITGRSDGDGSYDAQVRAAKGKGDFAGVDADGDVTVDVSASGVDVDLDGEYGYGDPSSAGSGRAGGNCPHGQSDQPGSDQSGSSTSSRRG